MRYPLLFALAAAAAATASATLAPFTWTTTRPLVFPDPDATHSIVSVKDPTVVYYNSKWQVFATTADKSGNWSMVYLNFPTWEDAVNAKEFYIDQNPGLRGYHCAPQVFFFRPQNKWYLIYQSQDPTYSTTDDIENPASWTAPKHFFASTPPTVVQSWIDYWIICDDTNAYLFFSDDHGRYYRTSTKLTDFPNGFSDPVVIMQDSNAFNLFEGSCVYRLKGQNQYLCFIECLGGPSGRRYFRAFTSDRLDGDWTPLPQANSWDTPFAGANNVRAADGGTPWSADISHGELIRDGYDETMTVDPANLSFLYQGMNRNVSESNYSQQPYRLALLQANPPPVSDKPRVINISNRAYCGVGNRVAIGGFAVTGTQPKRVLIRAIGPGLTTFGLSASEVLADPVVDVYDPAHGNAIIASNDNWGDNANAVAIKELSATVNATAIPAGDTKSSALALALQPGLYTFIVHGQNESSGIVLLEVYEIDDTAPSTFVNISSRAYAQTGNGAAIAGFVVTGNQPKRVLMRALGPTLKRFNVADADLLQDPTIELHDASHGNVVIATNDDWAQNTNADEIRTTGASVGATPIAPTDSKSAALLMTLQPAAYTFIARGANDTSGVVLIEVYDAD